MQENSKANKLTKILFIIYMIALFWIIIFKFGVPFFGLGYMRKINLVLFKESLMVNGRLDFSEIIMNAVIFTPLGVYSGILLKKWSTGKKILLYFLISLICEVSQFILGVGTSDITDIITNTLGGIIGSVIYKGIEKVSKDKVAAQKFINVIATIGTIFMSTLLSMILIYNL